MNEHIKKELWSWSKLIMLALLIVIPLHQFGFHLTIVQGQSMMPTLAEGQRLFVNRAVFLWTDPQLSDIVILKEPLFTAWNDPFLVKRVVALEGDRIEIRNGTFYRNGQKVTENYTDVSIEDGDYGPDVIAPGYVFVMGDNRRLGSSKDSRYFGQVPIDAVIGRAEYRVWPFSRAGEIE